MLPMDMYEQTAWELVRANKACKEGCPRSARKWMPTACRNTAIRLQHGQNCRGLPAGAAGARECQDPAPVPEVRSDPAGPDGMLPLRRNQGTARL